MLRFLVAATCVITACGGEEEPPPPSDGGTMTTLGAVAEPMPPAPRMVTCREGWVVETTEDGYEYCAGWAGAAPTCAPDEALVPGVGCLTIATCPSEAFPPDQPEGAVYVSVGGTGDGAESTPFGSIDEALASGASHVVLGRGAHAAPSAPITTEVALVGGCVSETSIEGSVVVEGGPVRLEALTVTSSGGDAAIDLGSGGDLIFTHAVAAVPGNDPHAISSAGTLAVSDSRLEGGSVIHAGNASFSRVRFSGGAPTGDETAPPAALEVRGGRVSGEDLTFAELTNAGVSVCELPCESTAHVSIQGAMVIDLAGRGATVEGADSTLDVEDLTVLGVPADGSDTGGLHAQSDGTVIARRVAILGAPQFGIEAEDAGSVEAEDLLVRGTHARRNDQRQGMGVRVTEGAHLTLRRAELVGNRCAGLRVSLTATADVEDLVIRGTHGEAGSLEGGFGVRVDVQTVTTIRRVLLEDNHYAGVVADSLSDLTLEDVVIRDTVSREGTSVGGHGLHLTFASTARITRGLIERNVEAGLSVDGFDSRLFLEDVVVRDTASNDLGGAFGGGLSISGGSLDATRLTVERNKYVGLYVGEDAHATVRGLALSGVSPQRCAETDCAETPFGIGLGAFNRGVLEVDGFFAHDAFLCGVMVGPDSDLSLRHGNVSGSLIGACVQASPFDVSQINRDVDYQGNGQNLDSTSLPVPEAAPRIMD